MKQTTHTSGPVLQREAPFNPNTVIEVRTYGILDLEKYIVKIKKNIVIFEEAIEKEKKEMQRVKQMITVLKKDIAEAKSFKKKLTKRGSITSNK